MQIRLVLCVLALGGCVVGETSERSKPGTTRFALADGIGINIAADGAPGGAAVRDLGARWARIEIVDGQPTGAALADLRAHDIRVLAIVNYSTVGSYPGYYECGPGAGFDDWRARWVARVGEVAAAYGDSIDAWEVWNEEDHPVAPCDGSPVEYNPGMPAHVFGPMLRDAYVAIRASSNAPIVMGGTDSGQVSYVTNAITDGVLWADAVAIHPYGVAPDGSWCPNPGEDINCEWGTFHSKIEEYGAATGLPIWITEFGVRTQDVVHQASYLEDGFRAAAAHGSPAFYFCYSDAMVPPFGLTFADGTPKPVAFDRFRALTSTPATTNTSRMHGTVVVGGLGVGGLYVTAWGHGGDLHATYTDDAGIYAFEDLSPSSLYNVVVNATFDGAGFAPVDGAHAYEVRDNVTLVAGPDNWHGEDFQLPF
jgi:hypothetical protein